MAIYVLKEDLRKQANATIAGAKARGPLAQEPREIEPEIIDDPPPALADDSTMQVAETLKKSLKN